MMKRNMKRRTLEAAFSAGFLAGMAVVHSQDLVDQEKDYFNAWKRGDDHWYKEILEKYQKMRLNLISTLHAIAVVVEVITTHGKMCSSGTISCSKKKPKKLYRRRGIKKPWHSTMRN